MPPSHLFLSLNSPILSFPRTRSPHTGAPASHLIKPIKAINQGSLHLPASRGTADTSYPCSALPGRTHLAPCFPGKRQAFPLLRVPSALAFSSTLLNYPPSPVSLGTLAAGDHFRLQKSPIVLVIKNKQTNKNVQTSADPIPLQPRPHFTAPMLSKMGVSCCLTSPHILSSPTPVTSPSLALHGECPHDAVYTVRWQVQGSFS